MSLAAASVLSVGVNSHPHSPSQPPTDPPQTPAPPQTRPASQQQPKGVVASHVLRGHVVPVVSVLHSKDGSVYSAAADGEIRFWRGADGVRSRGHRPLAASDRRVGFLEISPGAKESNTSCYKRQVGTGRSGARAYCTDACPFALVHLSQRCCDLISVNPRDCNLFLRRSRSAFIESSSCPPRCARRSPPIIWAK